MANNMINILTIINNTNHAVRHNVVEVPQAVGVGGNQTELNLILRRRDPKTRLALHHANFYREIWETIHGFGTLAIIMDPTMSNMLGNAMFPDADLLTNALVFGFFGNEQALQSLHTLRLDSRIVNVQAINQMLGGRINIQWL